MDVRIIPQHSIKVFKMDSTIFLVFVAFLFSKIYTLRFLELIEISKEFSIYDAFISFLPIALRSFRVVLLNGIRFFIMFNENNKGG